MYEISYESAKCFDKRALVKMNTLRQVSETFYRVVLICGAVIG